MKVKERIHKKARYIVETGLQGITPHHSFDIGKIDYGFVDRNTLDIRIDAIVWQLLELIVQELNDGRGH